jgi:hypothetical protein
MQNYGSRAAAVGLVALTGLLGACGDDGNDLLDVGQPDDEPGGTVDEPDQNEAPEHGTPVEGDGWRGVLLNGYLDSIQPDDGDNQDATSFVPTEEDARQFEEQLPDVEPSGWNDPEPVDWSDYVRQYTGVEGAGERHLKVGGLCVDQLDGFDSWEKSWVEVSDGGTCFWSATMDLASGEIIQFGFNGEA